MKRKTPKRHNFNKGVKLHNVCSTCEIRPVMNYIYFDNGYAVASSGHILIKAYLKEISSFSDEEIEILNGKLLHRSGFAELIKHNLVSTENDGFLVESELFNMKIKFYDGELLKYPSYEKVFNSLSNEKVGEIAISSFYINALCDSVGARIVKLTFNGDNNGVNVLFSEEYLENTTGLIMPCFIDK